MERTQTQMQMQIVGVSVDACSEPGQDPGKSEGGRALERVGLS
jgi:hypothetical protein